MENWNFEHLLERFFDRETFRRFNILKVDTSERVPDRCDRIDETLGIGRVDLDIKNVDAGEFLKKDAFAFHDRLRG